MKLERKTVIFVDHGYQDHLALVAGSRAESEFESVPDGQTPPDRLTLGYFMAKCSDLLMAGNVHASFKVEFDVKHASHSFHDAKPVKPREKFADNIVNNSKQIIMERSGGFYVNLGEEIPMQRVTSNAPFVDFDAKAAVIFAVYEKGMPETYRGLRIEIGSEKQWSESGQGIDVDYQHALVYLRRRQLEASNDASVQAYRDEIAKAKKS
jgi:hypothetical protein